MRKHYLRFRIGLMTFTFGLAAVYLANGLYISYPEIPVKLPTAESADVLSVFSSSAKSIDCCRGGDCESLPTESDVLRKIVEARDMSLYTFGGRIGCGLSIVCDFRNEQREFIQARKFIWERWKSKTRGYLVVKMGSVDAESDAHIFIEPDEGGNWRLVWTWRRIVGMASCPDDVDKSPDIRSVEFKKTSRNDFMYLKGPMYLKMLDEDGNERTF